MDATHGVDANGQSVVATPVAMVPIVSTASNTTPLEALASTPDFDHKETYILWPQL